MAAEDEADRASFFGTDDFADIAIIGAGTIYETTANGIFDYEYIEAINVSSNTPIFNCRTSDVPNIRAGNNLTVKGLNFTIRDIQRDGTGLVLIILEKK